MKGCGMSRASILPLFGGDIGGSEMKHCAICNETIKSGVVCHMECVDLLNKALDVAARECISCPGYLYDELEWPECVGCDSGDSPTEDDAKKVRACWKRFFLQDANARRCRVCGCTDNHACLGGCYWVEEDLCSSCAEKAIESDQCMEASG